MAGFAPHGKCTVSWQGNLLTVSYEGVFNREGAEVLGQALEAPLAERAKALGQWCQGFLDGFGMVVGNAPLSAEAMEVLQDLSAIAQVQSGLEESEDGESDYMEVMEYLRVAPLLLFAECGKPAAPAPKPSLH